MPAAGLIEIRRRIKSVTNTKKITKAMGLVATSKLRKARERLDVNSKFYAGFDEILDEVLRSNEEANVYQNGNGSPKKLYISITSDTGLCGGYNSSVVILTTDELSKDPENSYLMVVGQKGRAFFNKAKFETVAEYVDIGDVPDLNEAKVIANHALRMYEAGEVGEIHVIYTRFVSPVKQTVEVKKILPLPNYAGAFVDELVKFEPEVNSVLLNLVDTYMVGKIIHYMFNSKVSEQSARMAAMDGATRNANDILEKLNLKYNRIRQSAITQEISEIVGGAEAQKG